MPMTPSDAGLPIICASSQTFPGSRTYPSLSATFTSLKRSVAARTASSVGSDAAGVAAGVGADRNAGVTAATTARPTSELAIAIFMAGYPKRIDAVVGVLIDRTALHRANTTNLRYPARQRTGHMTRFAVAIPRARLLRPQPVERPCGLGHGGPDGLTAPVQQHHERVPLIVVERLRRHAWCPARVADGGQRIAANAPHESETVALRPERPVGVRARKQLARLSAHEPVLDQRAHERGKIRGRGVSPAGGRPAELARAEVVVQLTVRSARVADGTVRGVAQTVVVAGIPHAGPVEDVRSEERRVGKECWSGWSPHQCKTRDENCCV